MDEFYSVNLPSTKQANGAVASIHACVLRHHIGSVDRRHAIHAERIDIITDVLVKKDRHIYSLVEDVLRGCVKQYILYHKIYKKEYSKSGDHTEHMTKPRERGSAGSRAEQTRG